MDGKSTINQMSNTSFMGKTFLWIIQLIICLLQSTMGGIYKTAATGTHTLFSFNRPREINETNMTASCDKNILQYGWNVQDCYN